MADEYRTSDLSLSAYFLYKKLTFLGLERKDHKSFWFKFSPINKCQQLSNEYFSGKDKVAPREFFEAIQRAKDIVFQNGRDEIRWSNGNGINPENRSS